MERIGSAGSVASIVARVLGVPPSAVTDDTGPGTLAAWDSHAHLDVVLSLEAAFGLRFSPDEAVEMLSVKLIKLLLAEKGVAVG